MHCGNSKFANHSRNVHRGGKDKKVFPSISEIEIKILGHFSRGISKSSKYPFKVPTVASIDWLMHVISLKEFVDVNCLDLFSLPADPIRYPTAFKAEYEFDPTSTDSSGERYSKYDLVYYSQQNLSSPNRSKTPLESLLIGKIIGFSRRNEDSAPMVRIQSVEAVKQPRILKLALENKSTSISEIVPNFSPVTNMPLEILISSSQLVGKVVLLHRTAFSEVHGYTIGEKSESTSCDHIHSTSLLSEEEWPTVSWKPLVSSRIEKSSDSDESEQPTKKRRIHVHSSQDF